MKKNILSSVLTFALLLTLCSVFAVNTQAATKTVTNNDEINAMLNAIDSQNFIGSGTTSTKAKQVIQHFITTSPFRQSFPYPNDVPYFYYVSDGTYSQNITGSTGCMTYCYYMEKNVYGRETNVRQYLQEKTASSIKSLLQTYGQAGDHIRFTNGSDNKHSLTFISCTNDGFYTLEYFSSKINLTYWTYADFISKCNGATCWLYDTNTAKNSIIQPTPLPTPIGKITNLKGMIGADASQVKLTWAPYPGTSYYQVYFERGDKSKSGYDSKEVKGTSFTSLGNDTKQSFYTFTVYAVNASGAVIAQNSFKYDMPAITNLKAVKGADASQVKLSWNSSPGASYYKVYFERGDGSKSGWDSKKVTGTSFTSLGNDTKQSFYTFTVYAVNSSDAVIAQKSVIYYMRPILLPL